MMTVLTIIGLIVIYGSVRSLFPYYQRKPPKRGMSDKQRAINEEIARRKSDGS